MGSCYHWVMENIKQQTRIIDGQVFKVQKLPPGLGGVSISKAMFGGKLGAKAGKGQRKDSAVERAART